MDDNTFFEFLAVREAALNAAVGHLVVSNLQVETLQAIADGTTDKMIALAASIALHERRRSG